MVSPLIAVRGPPLATVTTYGFGPVDWSPSAPSIVEHRHGADGRAVSAPDAQGEAEGPGPPAHAPPEVRQVLVVRDAALAAEEVDRVDAVGRVVGTRGVDAEHL